MRVDLTEESSFVKVVLILLRDEVHTTNSLSAEAGIGNGTMKRYREEMVRIGAVYLTERIGGDREHPVYDIRYTPKGHALALRVQGLRAEVLGEAPLPDA